MGSEMCIRDRGDTVKPRLIEAAADLDRVLVIDEAKRELTLSDERIEKAIIQNGLIHQYPIRSWSLLHGTEPDSLYRNDFPEFLLY